jgi:hypothetical protein
MNIFPSKGIVPLKPMITRSETGRLEAGLEAAVNFAEETLDTCRV